MSYADNFNLLCGCTNTMNLNTGTVLEGSKRVAVQINADELKCIDMYPEQSSGQDHNKKKRY
jgi:hypothetical protein